MPVFTEGNDPLDAGARDLVTPIVPADPKPNYDRPVDPFPAAFRQSNPMVSVVNALMMSGVGGEPDQNYNPFEAIRNTKYALEPDSFVGSANAAQTQSIISRIDQRDRDREILAAAGPAGTVASLIAGQLDPTVFLPAGGVIKAVKGGYSVFKSAALGSAGFVGQAMASEGLLQASQIGRPTDDIPFIVGSSALLGGLIGGGAAALLSRTERMAVEAALDTDRAAISAQAGLPGRPASAGAAASADARTLEPTSLIPESLRNLVPASVRDTANRWLNGVSPTMRTFFVRDSLEARRAMAELTEIAFDMKEHSPTIMRAADGKPVLDANGQQIVTAPASTTTRDGQAPVGRLSQMMQTQIIIDGGDELERQFLAYRYGDDGKGSMFVAAREDLMGKTPDKMTFGEFKAEAAKAIRNGDVHENPQIQAMAQYWRSRIFDPIHQRLVDSKLMAAEDAAPRGDKSFLTRLFDKLRVVEDRPEFHKIVSDWLEGEQTTKEGQKTRIGDFAQKRGVIAKQLSHLEGRLSTIAKRREANASQLKERVVELNSADKREAVVTDRETTIREGISELEEFIGAMRQEATDPDAIQRLNSLEDELKILKERERAAMVSRSRIAQDVRDETASLTGDMRTAGEVMSGARRMPEGESFVSYLVRNGGVADGAARDVFKDIKRPGLVRKTRTTASHNTVRDFDDWGQKFHDDFPHAFPERPDVNTVKNIMAEAAAGRTPWFMEVDAGGEVAEHVRVGALVDHLNDLFDRMDLPAPKGLQDVARALHSENPVTLQAMLDMEEKMHAAGATIPPRASREAQERLVATERDAHTQVKEILTRAIRDRNAASRERVKAGGHVDEAGVAVTRSEDRFEELQARGDRQATMQDLLETAQRNAKEEHARLTKSLEDEVKDWRGHSSGEAIAAIAKRDEAERLRQLKIEAGVYGAKADESGNWTEGKSTDERMTGADGAVDRAIKRMLDTDQRLTREDLEARAHEIIDRILGSPDGRLSYDAASNAEHIVTPRNEALRGSLKNRDFAIPSALIDKFLVNDVEQVLHSYTRSVIPDMLLHERFGDVEMSREMRKLNEEYAAKSMAAKTPKERVRIESDRAGAIQDLAAVRDRIRNVYGWPAEQAMPVTARVARLAKLYNTATDLGTSTLNSVPDMAGAVFQHGLQTVVGDAWAPYLAGMMQGGTAYTAAMRRQARDLLTGLETRMNLRGHSLSDMLDNYKPGSKLERGARWIADKSQLVNFQAPWTDLTKTMATTVAVAEHMRAIERTVAGKGTAADGRLLARSNINPETANKIWHEYTNGGGDAVDGTPFVDVMKWQDRDARETFMAAIGREADISVVTPGHEKSLWHSNPVLSLVGQFKSFVGATHEKLMIPGLQRRDANTLSGVLSAVSAGMLSYKLYSIVAGRETSDRPQDWIKEGISRGGVLGWLDETNNSGLSKLTSGRADIYRLIGADRPMSRFEQRSTAAALLGPTWGKIEGAVGASGSAFRGEWARSDTTAMLRLAPLRNLWYLRNLISEATDHINDAFGVPAKKAG